MLNESANESKNNKSNGDGDQRIREDLQYDWFKTDIKLRKVFLSQWEYIASTSGTNCA